MGQTFQELDDGSVPLCSEIHGPIFICSPKKAAWFSNAEAKGWIVSAHSCWRKLQLRDQLSWSHNWGDRRGRAFDFTTPKHSKRKAARWLEGGEAATFKVHWLQRSGLHRCHASSFEMSKVPGRCQNVWEAARCWSPNRRTSISVPAGSTFLFGFHLFWLCSCICFEAL